MVSVAYDSPKEAFALTTPPRSQQLGRQISPDFETPEMPDFDNRNDRSRTQLLSRDHIQPSKSDWKYSNSGKGPSNLRNDLILDLVAGDYAGGSVWHNRAANNSDAIVPDDVKYDSVERAFVFPGGGGVITVPLATNPQAMKEVSYAVWVKVPELATGNLGWCLCQAPDYSWSRALTLNDYRLGYVSITSSGYWDSRLGRAPVGRWIHVVGVWRCGGTSSVYLDGKRGADVLAKNGCGHDPDEVLMIGGRAAHDSVHNPKMAISDVRVYAKALTDAEVLDLFNLGPIAPVHYVTNPSPLWDDREQVFWYSTEVNAYDLPDGNEWHQEFEQSLQTTMADASKRTGGASTVVTRRTLKPQLSDPSPLVGGRILNRHTSDPDRMARRAAHTVALRKMSRRPGIAVHMDQRRIALFRFDGTVYAVNAHCPHQGGNLVEGDIGDIEDMVDGRKCYVTCPVHKFQFDLSTGAVLQGSCDPLQTYKVRLRIVDGKAVVDVGCESLSETFFVDFDVDDF